MSNVKKIRTIDTNPTYLPTLGDYPRKQKATLTVVVNAKATLYVTANIISLGLLAGMQVRGAWTVPDDRRQDPGQESLRYIELEDCPRLFRETGDPLCMGIGLLLQALWKQPGVVAINLGRGALEQVVREVMTSSWVARHWRVTFRSVAVQKPDDHYILSFIEQISGDRVVIYVNGLLMFNHPQNREVVSQGAARMSS